MRRFADEHTVMTALHRALQLQTLLGTAMLPHVIKATVPLSLSRRDASQPSKAIAQEQFVTYDEVALF